MDYPEATAKGPFLVSGSTKKGKGWGKGFFLGVSTIEPRSFGWLWVLWVQLSVLLHAVFSRSGLTAKLR